VSNNRNVVAAWMADVVAAVAILTKICSYITLKDTELNVSISSVLHICFAQGVIF